MLGWKQVFNTNLELIREFGTPGSMESQTSPPAHVVLSFQLPKSRGISSRYFLFVAVMGQKTIPKAVSVLSQDSAYKQTSVSVKWMNVFLTPSVPRVWKTHFHFCKTVALKNASKNNWRKDSVSEYSLEIASWETGLSTCCLWPSCLVDWFKDLSLQDVK